MDEKLSLTPGDEQNLSDVAAGAEFASRYGHRAKFNHSIMSWMVYEGGRWTQADAGQIDRFAKEFAQRYFDAAAEAATAGNTDWSKRVTKVAHRLFTSAGLRGLKSLAESETPVSRRSDDFDANPLLFNVENGTIELSPVVVNAQAFSFRQHLPDDMLTKQAGVAYDATASCPRFDRFLNETFKTDTDLIAYVQRLLGYCLAAGNPAHVFPICWGSGGNGKSTLFDLLLRIFGGYGQMLPGDALLTRQAGSASNHIADLKGVRLAVASELAERGIDTPLVKRLTGGDRLRARKLYREYEEFSLEATIVAYTNARPKLPADDEGVWRRVNFIPFTNVVSDTQRELDLGDQLWAERAGVLNWLLEGYAQWRQHGLNPPAAVQAATDELREELDLVSRFVTDACLVGAGLSTGAADLQAAFRSCCNELGERPVPMPRFKQRMEQLGYAQERRSGGYRYIGISLREPAGAELPTDLPGAA